MTERSFAFEINGDVLRWARESAGQSIGAVAERVNVAESTLKRWEEGAEPPEWNVLQSLAHEYQRPLAALLLPEPPAEPDLLPDFRTLPAARRTLSVETRLAIRTARWLQGRAIELREQMGIEQRFPTRVQIDQDPEFVAQQQRRLLGIDLEEQTSWTSEHKAYGHWRAALESLGLLVLQFRFAVEEVRGFSLFHPTVPLIVANEADLVQARIFTLFHEYAHVLLQKPAMCLPNEVPSARDSDVEVFCNRFAAAVLIPPSVVQSWNLPMHRIAPEQFDQQLQRLASRYRVSKLAVLVRLRSTGRVSEGAYKQMTQRWKLRAESTPIRPRTGKGGPSAVQTCLRQRGKTLISLVLEGARRGVITTHDALTYLGVRVKDLAKLESTLE